MDRLERIKGQAIVSLSQVFNLFLRGLVLCNSKIMSVMTIMIYMDEMAGEIDVTN